MATSNVNQTVTKEQQTYSINWTINNWNVGCLPGSFLESEPLALTKEAAGQPKLTWILKFYPRGLEGGEARSFFTLDLLPIPPVLSIPNAKVQLQFSFIMYQNKQDNNGRTYEAQLFTHHLPEATVDCKGKTWDRTIIGQIIMGISTIRFVCTITCCVFDSKATSRTLSQFSHSPGDFSLTVSNCQSLGDDFNAVFDSPDLDSLADVTVTYGDGETLRVMKSILQVRSPVFRAMFSSKCLEQQTGELRLDDCFDKAAVTAFFRYLHSGCVSLHSTAGLPKTLKELVYLANKYCVNGLLDHLQKCILDNIALMREHLVFLTELSYTHSLTELKAKCIDLARIGIFPNREDRTEVEAFKVAVASHVQLAWDLLGLQ